MSKSKHNLPACTCSYADSPRLVLMSDFNPEEFVVIPDGWSCKRLVDCTTDGNISYGIVQPGQHQDGGIPVIRVNNVNNGQLKLSDVLKVSPEVERKYKRTRLKGGEVLLTLVGTTGQSFVAPSKLIGWNVPRAIAVIRVSEDIGAEWVNLCLQSKNTKHFLDVRANTTVQKTLNLKDVRDIPVLIPPRNTKEEIESTVLSFSKKIELLREQNKTLETLAQTIFKEWFVNFNYPDLSACGSPAQADATGEMVDSELGEIPQGWRAGKLGDVTSIKGGGTPSTKNEAFWNGDIHWTSPKDLSNSKSVFLLDTEKKLTPEGLKKVSSGLLPKGTLLLSSRAPIGYIAISNVDIAINQGYIAMLDDADFSNYYMLFWLKTHMRAVTNAANGSTFLEISKSAFRNIDCVIPSNDELKVFDETVEPILDKVLENIKQPEFVS